jgi:hypothetical protein
MPVHDDTASRLDPGHFADAPGRRRGARPTCSHLNAEMGKISDLKSQITVLWRSIAHLYGRSW